jgi:hypothetical protein
MGWIRDCEGREWANGDFENGEGTESLKVLTRNGNFGMGAERYWREQGRKEGNRGRIEVEN